MRQAISIILLSLLFSATSFAQSKSEADSLYIKEKYEEAAKMNEALSPLFKNLFIEPNPIPGKAAMALLGLMENSLRLPLVSALPETEKIMAQTLKDLNLL